ncbi:hypothetical protein [Pseudoroseicyclus aestuarii]|uniref:Uncharacterized protein n=1 Tax=Pseudoroseicyclus aestuarii TaxID=1795041 RepID=A0A318SYK9_9RHOB|nr:hypothetical protein [Pseudoroseicyclus aestuarii]PYE80807.1 hypothetical protein DFP88_11117 [Pseudoroseicyclus aestuarii]
MERIAYVVMDGEHIAQSGIGPVPPEGWEPAPPEAEPLEIDAWWRPGGVWERRPTFADPIQGEADDGALVLHWEGLPAGAAAEVDDLSAAYQIGWFVADAGGSILLEITEPARYRVTLIGPREYIARSWGVSHEG